MIIKVGDEPTVTATYHGLVNISQDFKLNTLYTPTFWLSRLSINQRYLAGDTTTFRCGVCSIFNKSTRIIPNGTSDRNVLQSRYALNSENSGSQSTPTKKLSSTELTLASINTTSLWHRQLAHLHPAVIQSLIDRFNDLDPTGMCNVCLQAKKTQNFIRTKVNRMT
jgi:hypothetical protein